MAALVDLTIAGRTYQVACREGEEENLRSAARLVDGKSREALSGLADQLITKDPQAAAPAGPDPALAAQAEALASRLELLAETLEREAPNP